MGDRLPVPRTPAPLGNFYGLVLRIALGATRGDAELEADRERFELPMGGALGLDASVTYLNNEPELYRE